MKTFPISPGLGLCMGECMGWWVAYNAWMRQGCSMDPGPEPQDSHGIDLTVTGHSPGVESDGRDSSLGFSATYSQ